jgi:hypothetical protein
MASQAFAVGGPEILIKKGKFTINKVKVNESWSVYQVKEVLTGSPRIRTGYNTTHTYDNLGIVVFEAAQSGKGTGVINELQVFFMDIEPNEVTPKNTTNASVKIEKLKITRDLCKADMLKGLSKWRQTESYLDHSFRMSKGGIYIYFQFSDDEMQLRKISIGRDNK